MVVNAGSSLGASTNELILGTPVPATGGTTTPTANLTLNTSVTVASFSSTTDNATADIVTIAPGATLTDNGAFTVGGNNNSGSSSVVYNGAVTFTGGGSLVVSGSGNFTIGGTSTNTSGKDTTTADLSGLNSLNVNTTGTVGIGNNINSAGILNLADTTVASVAPSNFINTSDLEIGNSQANNAGPECTLTVGSGTNTIEANTIDIGIAKQGAIVTFSADSAANSSITITGTGGGGALANITLGEATAATYTAGRLSDLLLAGHNANVQSNTVIVGESTGNTVNGPNAALTLDTGTFSVQTLKIAADTGGTSTIGPVGAITIGGASPNTSATGVLTVDSDGAGLFELGVFSGSAKATASASFTINSGTVNTYSSIYVNNTSANGTVTSTLTLAGNGVLNMEGNAIGYNGAQGSGNMAITTVSLAPNATDTPTLATLLINAMTEIHHRRVWRIWRAICTTDKEICAGGAS